MILTERDLGIPKLIEAIAEICRERGRETIAAAAAETLDSERPRWMIVADDLEIPGSSALVRVRAAAHGAAREISLQHLVSNPAQTLVADRVVVFLRCGTLLSAEEMEAVVTAVISRPSGSFALVCLAGDALIDWRDFETFGRGLKRWAGTGEGSDGGDASHGLFIVAGARELAANGELSRRLKREGRRLDTWLEAPSVRDNILGRWRVLYLLGNAEAALDDAPVDEVAVGIDTAERDAAQRTVRELGRGRQALAKRIDTDLAALGRELVLSLEQKVAETACSLRRLLEQRTSLFPSAPGARRLRSALEQELRRAGDTWQRDAEGQVHEAERALIRDLGALFSVVDWTLVERWVPVKDDSYPGSLFESLRGRMTDAFGPALTAESFVGSWSWRPSHQGRGSALIYSAAAAALSAGFFLGVRVPLPWVTALAGSAALGAGLLGQTSIREKTVRMGAAEIEASLRRGTSESEHELREVARELRQQLLDPLVGRVEHLESLLVKTPVPRRDDVVATAPRGDQKARLQELRRRVLEIAVV